MRPASLVAAGKVFAGPIAKQRELEFLFQVSLTICEVGGPLRLTVLRGTRRRERRVGGCPGTQDALPCPRGRIRSHGVGGYSRRVLREYDKIGLAGRAWCVVYSPACGRRAKGALLGEIWRLQEGPELTGSHCPAQVFKVKEKELWSRLGSLVDVAAITPVMCICKCLRHAALRRWEVRDK